MGGTGAVDGGAAFLFDGTTVLDTIFVSNIHEGP